MDDMFNALSDVIMTVNDVITETLREEGLEDTPENRLDFYTEAKSSFEELPDSLARRAGLLMVDYMIDVLNGADIPVFTE